MSNKKQFNDDELEKVAGGEETPSTTNNVIVKYKNTVDGKILEYDLGRFEISYAQTMGESLARDWCTTNNKIYDSYYLADLLTNNYDTRVLLDSLSIDKTY